MDVYAWILYLSVQSKAKAGEWHHHEQAASSDFYLFLLFFFSFWGVARVCIVVLTCAWSRSAGGGVFVLLCNKNFRGFHHFLARPLERDRDR